MGEKRPYTIDYKGSKGHVAKPRRVIPAAFNHLEKTGQKHCVIELPSGEVFDVWWNRQFGPVVQQRGKSKVVKLRRVK